jgi:hypothetical protein
MVVCRMFDFRPAQDERLLTAFLGMITRRLATIVRSVTLEFLALA